MNFTAHSEIGDIQRVYLKSAESAFRSQDIINQHWKELNYYMAPDFKIALEEYAYFVKLLGANGVDLNFFPDDYHTGMDALYCRDASLATDHGIILCRMGKELRQTEPDAQRRYFESKGEKILGMIESPGLLEGGDVAWLDEKTLAVGQGYRTNLAGLEQLASLLAPYNIEVLPVHLPHYKGPKDVFHLMSIFSPVDKNLAVVYSSLMPVDFRNNLLDRGFELVEVPEVEFDSMACNVLALSPRNCVMVSGNPLTKTALEKMGCDVHEYAGSHISLPGGGGPTCLTRPRWRSRQ